MNEEIINLDELNDELDALLEEAEFDKILASVE